MSETYVPCAACRGQVGGCEVCLHDSRGYIELGMAVFYCRLFLLTDDTTQAEKQEVRDYALRTYNVDIFIPRPRTPLDDEFDRLGIP